MRHIMNSGTLFDLSNLRRTASALLLSTATFLSASAADWGPGVRMTESVARIMSSVRTLGDKTGLGYDDNLSIMSAFLGPKGEARMNRTFQAGTTYTIIGGGDDKAGDVDIQILNAAGTVIAQDTLTDSSPIVHFTPVSTGSYTLRLHLYEGQGSFCTAAILKDGGYSIPVSNLADALRGLIVRCNVLDRNVKDRITFHDTPNSWAMIGAVFSPGESQTLTKVNLGTGRRVMLSAGDGNSRDIDLFVLDSADQIQSKDDDADPLPIVSVNTRSASSSGLRITNAQSSGRTLILTAYLDLESNGIQ
jgi:hypothetical protein